VLTCWGTKTGLFGVMTTNLATSPSMMDLAMVVVHPTEVTRVPKKQSPLVSTMAMA
jgi:hypothetical protein